MTDGTPAPAPPSSSAVAIDDDARPSPPSTPPKGLKKLEAVVTPDLDAPRPPDTWRLAWERATTIPLALAATAFLAAYAIPIAWPNVGNPIARICTITMQVAWLTMFVDYEVRFLLARRKVEFFLGSFLDFVVLVLPAFHFLRMLRLVALLSILDRAGVRTLRGRVMAYAVATTGLVFLVGALAVTQVERDATGSTILNLGDGFWFSIVTMTTVGYGDMLPVTTAGRVIAAGLMITGLAMLGTVTATLASWLTSKVVAGSNRDATRADIVALSEQLKNLREFLHDPKADEPLGPPPKPAKPHKVAIAAEQDVRALGRAMHLPHLPGPWITLHKARGIVALIGAGVALLFGLAGLGAVAAGSVGQTPTQAQLDNTIAGMPSALAFYLLGTFAVSALAVWVAAVAFRRASGPGWMWIVSVVAALVAYGTTTLTLLDQVSSTALVSTLSITFPFAAGVVMAMAFAQSRKPEPPLPPAAN